MAQLLQEIDTAQSNGEPSVEVELSSTFASSALPVDLTGLNTPVNITIHGGGRLFNVSSGRHFSIANADTGRVTLADMMLDGGSSGGGVNFGAGHFALEGITFTNIGSASAIDGSFTSLNVRDCTFSSFNAKGIRAVNGETLLVEDSYFLGLSQYAIEGGRDVSLVNCLFQDINYAGYHASAVLIGTNLSIDSCSFINSGSNSTSFYGYNNGAVGGIGAGKTLTVDNSLFKDNAALKVGGAISLYQFGGTATIRNSHFEGNKVIYTGVSYGDGGAIGVWNNGTTQPLDIAIEGCTFLDNYAPDDGGAVIVEGSNGGLGYTTNAYLYNNTFVGNKAGNDDNRGTGGAVQFSLHVGAVLEGNTFYNNQFGDGTKGGNAVGLYTDSTGGVRNAFPEVTLRNNLFVGNGDGSLRSNVHLTYFEDNTTNLLEECWQDEGGNIGFDAETEAPTGLSAETVFGSAAPALATNGNTAFAGESSTKVPLATLFIAPAQDATGLYADGGGDATNGTLQHDGRGFARVVSSPDAGAVEITWALFDANGGSWGSPAAYSYTTPQMYNSSATRLQAVATDAASTVAAPAEPTNSGKTFGGWTTVPDDATTLTATFTADEGTTTYFAYWGEVAPATYTVTYLPGAGDTTGTVPVDATAYTAGANATVASPGSLARDGYSFAGWRNSVNNTLYQAGAGFVVNGNTSMTAEWSKNPVTPSQSSGPSSASTSTTTPTTTQPASSRSSRPGGGGGGSATTSVPTTTRVVYSSGASSSSSTAAASSGAAETSSPSVSAVQSAAPSSMASSLPRDSSIDTADVEGSGLPLFGLLSGNSDHWSLLNLIIALLMLGASIFFILRMRGRQGTKGLGVGSIITGVLGIVVFVLTQDITKPMGFVDLWTVFMVVLAALQGVLWFLYGRSDTEEDEDMDA